MKVEHLAAEEPDVFFSGGGGDQTKAKRKVNIGLSHQVATNVTFNGRIMLACVCWMWTLQQLH